eukprot:75921_1
MAKKQKQFRKTTKRDDDTNEEKRSQRMRTDMAADTTRLLLMERLVVYLHTRGMDARILCDFLDALIEQEYDTDSIEYDGSIALKSDSSSQLTLNLKLECNLRTILKQSNGNEKQFRKVTRYLFESDVHTKVYGHGIRFYYWEFYRNTKGDEDTPVIFTNMDNISITSQQHWADPGNPGYKTRDWYIEPKFEDMRDEILSNPIYSLTKEQFDSLQHTAAIQFGKQFCRNLTQNKYLAGPYEVKEMQLKHVVAMLLYTNYTDLCTAFARTLRRNGMYETDEEWKARHANYWHMAKTLREMVEVFGMDRFDTCNAYRKLHHGIGAPLYLKSMHTTFCGTMSTSMNLTVASRFATDKDDGVVLTLFTPQTRTLLFGFECWRISAFPHEEE